MMDSSVGSSFTSKILIDSEEIDADDEDQFCDFTTATEWELFTSNLERLFNEWQSQPFDAQSIHSGWIISHHKINFAEFPFKLSYYKNTLDRSFEVPEVSLSKSSGEGQNSLLPPYLSSIILEVDRDANSNLFPNFHPHFLSQHFDLKEFCVLTSGAVEPIQTESRLKVLLSSACIALSNTSSNFPLFVQFHQWSQNYFMGLGECFGIRTSFQMIHLRRIGKQYQNLAGLLDIFRSKVGLSLPGPINISVNFTYRINTWHDKYLFETEFIDVLEAIKEENGEKKELSSFTHILPFGCADEPLSALVFEASWPFLTEDAIVDSQTYSDLQPNQAQESFFSLEPNSQLDFRLNEMLEGFWRLNFERQTVQDILGKDLSKGFGNEPEYMTALDRLTKSNSPMPSSVNKVFSNVARAQKQLLYSPLQYTDLAPLSQEQLDLILVFLFPDSSSAYPYQYPQQFQQSNTQINNLHIQSVADGIQSAKSAPVGGLVWRLSIILSYIYLNVGKNGGLAHVWAEVILELRYRFENSIMIPGLESGSPNTSTCLLNQKLQMLNCCIEKKLNREKKEYDGTVSNLINKDTIYDASTFFEAETVIESDEEDEFFDCEENNLESSDQSESVAKRATPKPCGRLRRCGRLLLLDTGEPMYIPITQDPAPLTEDILEEQARVLENLGSDAEGSELRAKLMSASLVSDIQSFKAANPGSILQDFVRWYSPRDWIESDETDKFGNRKGELSPRMKVPGNLWLEVWSSSLPIPARRQKRLFDDTKEAENIFHWMSTRSLHEICQLIFPCLAHISTLKLLEEVDKLDGIVHVPVTISHQLLQLTRSIGKDCLISKNKNFVPHEPIYSQETTNSYKNSLLSILSSIEQEVCQIRSFQLKFPVFDLKSFGNNGVNKNDNKRQLAFLNPNKIKIDREADDLMEKIRDFFNWNAQEQGILIREANGVLRNEFESSEPIKKEFVLRYCPTSSKNSISPNSDFVLPHRMSCILRNEEFLVCGTFSSRTELV